MLVIQPIGGAGRLARALPRGRPHRALRAHVAGPARSRSGGSATTPSPRAGRCCFEHLVDDPAWLTRRLDFPRPDEFAAEGAALLLYFVRRYSAKLLYELELHAADDPTTMRARYVELLGDALKIEPSADRLPRRHRRGLLLHRVPALVGVRGAAALPLPEFGNDWFARPQAGSLLRELWSLGQRPTADELLGT